MMAIDASIVLGTTSPVAQLVGCSVTSSRPLHISTFGVVVAIPFIVAIGYPASPTLWILLRAINGAILDFLFRVFFFFPAFQRLFLSVCP